jgi:hypothetical protein
VAEGTGFENRRSRKGSVSSNLTSSAETAYLDAKLSDGRMTRQSSDTARTPEAVGSVLTRSVSAWEVEPACRSSGSTGGSTSSTTLADPSDSEAVHTGLAMAFTFHLQTGVRF